MVIEYSMVFKKGEPSWNKGKKCPKLGYWKGKKKPLMSEATKKKISKANKGRKRPDLVKFNKTYWKGKKKPPMSETVRKKISIGHTKKEPGTTTYRKWGFELYGKKCSRCFLTEKLIVHHKDGNRKNNIRENLMVLCGSCHAKEHKKENNFKLKI